MCTCMALNFDRFYFGRNMDLEGSFGERVVIAPRFFPVHFRDGSVLEEHYAILGMAAVADGYPLFADAMNEKGLCMAGLNFPGNAVYQRQLSSCKKGVSPFELIPYILASCASTEEAETVLRRIELIDIPFSKQLPLTPLHWMVADRERALTVEPMSDGLHIYDNPVGVLTNNPPFPYHLANLSQYANLSAAAPKANAWQDDGAVSLGLGGLGLPGDYSSVSRFVRACFLKRTVAGEKIPEAQIDAFFQILSSVAPTKGAVLSRDGRPHYTTYSCCMDAVEGRYYCKKSGYLAVSAFCMEYKDERSLCFL